MSDPSALFALGALATFITGATSEIASAQASDYLASDYLLGDFSSTSSHLSDVFADAQALLFAGLIAAIIAPALWRAVVHAVVTGRRVSTGWRAGLGLGMGIALCELTDSGQNGTHWLPAHPEAVLIFVAVAVGLTAWTAQHAELEIRRARGRSLLPMMIAGSLAVWLVLAFLLNWWYGQGHLLTQGWPWSATSQLNTIGLRGLPTAHPDLILQFATVLIVLPGIFDQMYAGLPWSLPLLWSVLLLWLLPLLAWARNPPVHAPRWLVRARNTGPHAAPLAAHVPRVGSILRAGVIGGLVSSGALLAVRAYTDTQRQLFTTAWGAYELSFITWVIIAICGVAILTSIVAALRGPQRFALLAALISSAVAAAIGLVCHYVLASVDGCLGPLNVQSTQCAWRPAQALNDGLPLAVDDALCLTVLVAVLVGAAISAARSLRHPSRGTPHDDSLRRVGPGRAAPGLAGWRIATVAIAATTAAAIASTYYQPPQNPDNSVVTATDQFGPTPGTPIAVAPSDAITALQVHAWQAVGGIDLASGLMSAWDAFYNAFKAASDAPDAEAMGVFNAKVPATCTQLAQATHDAETFFFPVPAASGQKLWSATLNDFRIFAAACNRSVQQQATNASLDAVTAAANNAGDSIVAFHNWLKAQERLIG